MFCSVLHNLKSPQNVGMIVRTHVAFGGGPIVFVGSKKSWEFKKGTQAFSRKLENLCELVFLENDDAFFDWSEANRFAAIAIEISERAQMLPEFQFPPRAALVVGNEASGLPAEFLDRCQDVVSIPQFGEVECLNVAVSSAVAMYELSRRREDVRALGEAKYRTGR